MILLISESSVLPARAVARLGATGATYAETAAIEAAAKSLDMMLDWEFVACGLARLSRARVFSRLAACCGAFGLGALLHNLSRCSNARFFCGSPPNDASAHVAQGDRRWRLRCGEIGEECEMLGCDSIG